MRLGKCRYVPATAFVLATLVLGASTPAAQAARMGLPQVAGVQVALRAKGLYSGNIDGWDGPATSAAVRALQRQAGLAVDGVPGPATLAALGRRGRPPIGRRPLREGDAGLDVAELQFMLAWHGFPNGAIDGGFGPHTLAALIRFQRWAHTHVDGVAGWRTLAPLTEPPRRPPVSFVRPVRAPIGDGFGPRGNRFHPGLDMPAPTGTTVFAARSGRVTWAGWRPGGYGNLVSIAHGGGVRSMYGHLSAVLVRDGQAVRTGTVIGRVGSTGLATGPHLHFEVRLRGAALDPAGSF